MKANYGGATLALGGFAAAYAWADSAGYVDQLINAACNQGKEGVLLFIAGVASATVGTHVLTPKNKPEMDVPEILDRTFPEKSYPNLNNQNPKQR